MVSFFKSPSLKFNPLPISFDLQKRKVDTCYVVNCDYKFEKKSKSLIKMNENVLWGKPDLKMNKELLNMAD